MADAKQQQVHGCIKHQTIVTFLVAMLCVQLCHVNGAESSCEDRTTVQRYINASGDNYVSYETCLNDEDSCPDHSTLQQITTVAVYQGVNNNNYREVEAYWNNEQFLLKIHSSLMLEPFDVVTRVSYTCRRKFGLSPTFRRSLIVTVRLKPIRVELQINNAIHDGDEPVGGQSGELHCVISGQFDGEHDKILIHYVHEEPNATTVTTYNYMHCKYVDHHTQNDSSSTTWCVRPVSHLGSGQYYCTVVINGEYFTSNVKNISLKKKESDPKLPQQNTTGIIIGGVVGALLLVLLVSVMIIIYTCFRRRRNVDLPPDQYFANNEGRHLLQGNQPEQVYEAIDEDRIDRNVGGRGSRAHSEGSQNSQGSGGSSPYDNVLLPQQQGNGEDNKV